MEANALIDLAELRAVLEEYAREAAEIYKYQISLGGKNASRKLIESVTTRVAVNGKEWEVKMSLEEYWKYVEGGAKGTESSPPGAVYPAHYPPPQAIEQWINVKPILPRPLMTGDLKSLGRKSIIPSPKTLAFLIGRKILRKGIAPYPAMKTTQEELNKIYRDRISAALGHDMTNYIRKVVATE